MSFDGPVNSTELVDLDGVVNFRRMVNFDGPATFPGEVNGPGKVNWPWKISWPRKVKRELRTHQTSTPVMFVMVGDGGCEPASPRHDGPRATSSGDRTRT